MLRFHTRSFWYGFDAIYIVLCLGIVLVSCITGWHLKSGLLYYLGYITGIWLIYHSSAQILTGNLVIDPIVVVFGFILLVASFLALAYYKSDIDLVLSVSLTSYVIFAFPGTTLPDSKSYEKMRARIWKR